jgi:hypothetical protein
MDESGSQYIPQLSHVEQLISSSAITHYYIYAIAEAAYKNARISGSKHR